MMNETFTVFGANGFIGSALCKHLRASAFNVNAVGRSSWPDKGLELGHIIYAAGMTSRFLELPFSTVETQVSLPARILENYQFSSFLYLSSTRLYKTAQTTAENAVFKVSPTVPADIYTLTKTAAECLCFAQVNPNVRVARLSNVYGQFRQHVVSLASMLADAVNNGHVTFRSSPESSKDYVSLNDVVSILPKISLEGKEQLFNVATGKNTTNLALANAFENLGITTSFEDRAETIIDKVVDVTRLSTEFGFARDRISEDLAELLQQTSQHFSSL